MSYGSSPCQTFITTNSKSNKTFTYEWFDGYKKSVKLQKVSAPYVDLEKLKANPKDYKKYVKYNTQYRLTASADKMGLKEVA